MHIKPISSIHVLLLSLSMLGYTSHAFAVSCVKNCLAVWSLSLTDQGTSIRATVKLVDEHNSSGASRNSTVHGLWTRPDGSSVLQYARIGTRLRADFNFGTGGAAGTYRFEVIDVIRTGYTFDPSAGAETTSILNIQDSNNQSPLAVINTDQVTGEAPLDVNFDALSSRDPDGVISSYHWNFGDGTVSNEPNLLHTYAVSGNYTVTLSVHDDMGARASSSIDITVDEPGQSVSVGCVARCLAINEFKMSYKRDKVIGKIRIMDENGDTVHGAVIDVLWTLPDGSDIFQRKQNDGRKFTGFRIPANLQGRYTLSVVDLSKPDYRYAPGLNIEQMGSYIRE
ncbi:MAG: PKD domain-containing protein [Candidatus Thiodiazotropha sp.]